MKKLNLLLFADFTDYKVKREINKNKNKNKKATVSGKRLGTLSCFPVKTY